MNPSNIIPLIKAISTNPKALGNLAVSAAIAGLGVFWTVHMACPDATGCWNTAWDAGFAAGGVALVQHLRAPAAEVPKA